MAFSEAQLEAINHDTGPALILAGPGSGKTTVITHRTKTLIEQHHVSPSNILVITFTKMAANEMKERFRALMKSPAPVTFGTFHAVFFTILKHAYHYSAANIVREEQQREVIKQNIGKYELEVEDENDFVTQVLAEISKVKNERIDISMYYSIHCPENVFRGLFADYDSMLQKHRLIDFDDMLVYCYELLEKRPDILAMWQEKYQYILIDEFQDINKIQYDIVKLLAAKRRNLFIVGDDDQSIYGFRGAKPEIMMRFKRDFPECAEIKLDINYRSTAEVVAAARKVIDHNTQRFHKDIRTYNQQGAKVDIHGFPDTVSENEWIAEQILKDVKDDKKRLNDIAVLTRTNVGARQLMGKFIEYSIPFTTRDSVPNLYEHWIARNILAYIRMALGSRERNEFIQIMNKPKRYLSRDCLAESEVDFDAMRQFYEDKSWVVERIDDLETDLRVLTRCNPMAGINYIRRGIKYDDYLREYAKERHMNEEELFNVVDEIQEAARDFKTYEEWFEYIAVYSSELKEQMKQRKEQKETPSVSICTMHSAKGLEYRSVYIIDANEGVVPYQKAVLDTEIEEERRMFYVAMTRAKEELHIYHVEERYNKKLEVSRFVQEILS